MQFTLYLITNTVTGVQYVGKTIGTIKKRWRAHKHSSRHEARRDSKSYLHNAIRKYGTSAFTIEVIHTVAQDERSLNEWEMFYIAALRQAGKLYNMTDGGDGASGFRHTEKYRDNKADAQRIDLIGHQFGRWTVLKLSDERSYRGTKKWLCKCVCGNSKPVTSASLLNGKSQSCGCFAKERRREGIGRHTRWHVNRNVTNPNCLYCQAGPNASPSPTESTAVYATVDLTVVA